MFKIAIHCLMLLVLFPFTFSACDHANADRNQYLMHYVQVPQTMEDGSAITDEQVRKFEEYLVQLAGGYTKLNETSGGSLGELGEIRRRAHISYLVGSSSDEREQLAQYVMVNFGYDSYIFAWEVRH